MPTIKRFIATLLIALLTIPSALAQNPPQGPAQQDVLIIIQQEKVRFTAQKAVQEMRLQIFDQTGELVYDSGAIAEPELIWPLQNGNGDKIKSGLYAYTLSIREGKEAGTETARVRRGHFIVDKANDRDGNTDKLWVTSQNDNGVGTELTVARDESTTVAGASTITDRKTAPERKITKTDGVETTAGDKKELNAVAAASGTSGQLAKFTSATDLGNSVITEKGGNIGIGTTTPQHRLSLSSGSAWTSNGWGGALALENGNAIGWKANTAGQRFGIGHTNGGLFFFRTASDPGTTASPSTYDLAISDAGNVGIGTTNPQTKLAVQTSGYGITQTNGTVTFGSYIPLQNGTGGGSGWFGTKSNHPLNFFTNDGLPQMTLDTSGNVGIGTDTPTSKLYVLNKNPGTSAIFAESTTGRGVWGKSKSSRGVYGESVSNVGVWGFSSDSTGVIGQSTNGYGVDGNSASPDGFGGHFSNTGGGKALRVDGIGSLSVLEITGGSDFAEKFDVNVENHVGSLSGAEIQAGMVVAIDPANPGKLSLSRRAYDRRVAGIISGAGGVRPGMTMGQEQTLADGKYPVALSGRVYVWADATGGAIRPGDLLTSARTPGHAMKVAVPAKAQGAILGKAMTGLKSGKGLVLVLVTLQ